MKLTKYRVVYTSTCPDKTQTTCRLLARSPTEAVKKVRRYDLFFDTLISVEVDNTASNDQASNHPGTATPSEFKLTNPKRR